TLRAVQCGTLLVLTSCLSFCRSVSNTGVNMKTCAVFTICLLLLIPLPCANAQEANPRLTNDDVVKMVQAGVSTELIMSKIRKSETDFDTSPSALAALPKRGVPNQILLAMLESDPLGSNAHVIRKNGKRITAAEFKQLQASVLT